MIVSRSKEEYRDELSKFKRIQLKRVATLMDFIRDKIDLLSMDDRNSITITEDEANKIIGFPIEDIKDIYLRLSTKHFEVFRASIKSNTIYQVFQLPNPLTGRSRINVKPSKCINILFFPKDDIRNNNFSNFLFALTNKIAATGIDIERVENMTIPKEPIFDALNRIIYFGAISHSFQGDKGEQRLRLFKLLWEKRRMSKGTTIKRKGEPTPPETVAVNIGIIDSAQSYNKPQNAEKREKFRNFLKSINNDFRKKKMPIIILQKGGVLLYIKLSN